MIPTIENRTSVLILQHRRERFHPFNTARIVNQSLTQCELMVAHNHELAERFERTTLHEKVGLLYPGQDSPLLTDLEPDDQPHQLVVIDGTWHQAKTLFRDIPRLSLLPSYRLAPSTPGQYRIRREPNEHALSTLEATVAALGAIEPETKGLDQLTHVFEQMILDQLNNKSSQWRQNAKRRQGSSNIPRVLTGDLHNIVVAYGEQERRIAIEQDPVRHHHPWPMYWTAVRLSSGELFECAIDCPSLHDTEFRHRTGLDASVTERAVSIDGFRDRWRSFLRPDDHVATYHCSTARLLENVGAESSNSLILKSINVAAGSSAMDQLPGRLAFRTHPQPDSRAARRLTDAVALIEYVLSGLSSH